MDALLMLTIAAIALGGVGVAVFFWTLSSGQYDDLDGAAARILIDDDADAPEERRCASGNPPRRQ
jgi:cbb3-type cytochrome oxidase maturation protein